MHSASPRAITRLLLVQLFFNCTQMSVITYTNHPQVKRSTHVTCVVWVLLLLYPHVVAYSSMHMCVHPLYTRVASYLLYVIISVYLNLS